MGYIGCMVMSEGAFSVRKTPLNIAADPWSNSQASPKWTIPSGMEPVMATLRIFTLCFLAMLSQLALALSFTSHSATPVVIELFTSEGCSSCPPAERWLNGFTQHPGLWDQVFPLAWHVDYWDSIGWPDRFANPRHSARQWRYKRQTPLTSVYTPGVLVNGAAWRGWWVGRTPPESMRAAPGILYIELNGNAFEARYEVTPTSGGEASIDKGLLLHAVILGNGFSTEVRRGENAGKQLLHDFVVLADTLVPADDGRWLGALPDLPARAGEGERLAVVFWLERADSPVPLVITGGWLPDQWLDGRGANGASPGN